MEEVYLDYMNNKIAREVNYSMKNIDKMKNRGKLWLKQKQI